MELSVKRFLPAITHLFPGSGITVFTYKRTPFMWWETFARAALAVEDAQEKK